MRYWLIPVLAGLAPFASAQTAENTCSAEKIAEIVAPAHSGSPQVEINCSATLPSGSSISKELVFQGEAASNLTFDCNGAHIVRQSGNGDNVKIRSVQQNGQWQRPQNLTLRNCNIQGALRISGMDDDTLRAVSRRPDATQNIQAAAPTHITLDKVNITGNGRIPLYLRPGATYITVKNSYIQGQSDGTAVYFDMESAHNVFEHNTIEVRNKREQFALDGSAHNTVRHNRFLSPHNGGIFLYRNCGERGVIRHQTPSSNTISDNYFANKQTRVYRPIIWIASRNGGKSYCSDDAGYALGSSADDRDFAENNRITGNRFDKFCSLFTIKQNWQPNHISDNREQ
ncbi:right-handed parallel beta-helix repeat-containing protein [Neisseria sp. 83E34]|uniref:right-handed parallel beta-helix repeat-containing protein n=1 Tax=Neisseria sp. 83E34 TaxID=1692264 RepID=UPI0006CE764E|nr:right-handed parallel beta-helix repeat-containing protein [Neisseria sp. 83E34]KPN71237.1 hypothetical protein AKG09_07125 [Neisseria sp. 83E34]